MSDRLRVRILSRVNAERHAPGHYGEAGYEACISIVSPGQRPAALSSRFRDVLRLEFHDLAGFERPDGSYPEGAVQLSEADADRIAAFALAYRDAELLVVHCEAGISRSVAVGLALSTELGRYWAWPAHMPRQYREDRYIHNRAVFDRVVAAIRRAAPRPASADTATEAV